MRGYNGATTTVLKDSEELRRYLKIKRFQDVVLSALALMVLFPLLLVIAVVIVLDDPKGSPIFCQERVGKDGKKFRMYKFRSMYIDAEDRLVDLMQYNEMDGVAFKIKNDPRITKAGRFLRKLSLDELPQLVNVLKGDMSIIGPRPALPREVAQYTRYEWQRLDVTPGLTCYWQIQSNRYDLSMKEWVELDIKYIRERNWWLDWWLDWWLIWKTIGTILRREGE